MFLLKKLLAALILPPVGPILLALFGLWLMRRKPALGRWLCGLGLVSLLLMSVPAVSVSALHSLENIPPIAPSKLKEADAIVILGGGSYFAAPEYGGDTVSAAALERVRYGARLARYSRLPVLTAGGTVFGGQAEARSMETLLREECGIKVALVEDKSRDTRENAEFSARLLKEAGRHRIVLVSHAWHLPSAIPLFEAQGLEVIPAPTGYTTLGDSPWDRYLPSAKALLQFSTFLHEWLSRRVA